MYILYVHQSVSTKESHTSFHADLITLDRILMIPNRSMCLILAEGPSFFIFSTNLVAHNFFIFITDLVAPNFLFLTRIFFYYFYRIMFYFELI